MDVGAWRRRWAARGLFAGRNGKGVACRPEQAAVLEQREPLTGQTREADLSLRNREVKSRRRKPATVESSAVLRSRTKGAENRSLVLVRMAPQEVGGQGALCRPEWQRGSL